MVTSLFKHERIMTTHPKAKAAQRMAEKYINVAKRGTLFARRKAYSFIYEKDVVHKLFDTIVPRYEFRPKGYTRVLKVGRRKGDNAPISYLELVDRPGELRPAKFCTKEYAEQKEEQLRNHKQWQKQARL